MDRAFRRDQYPVFEYHDLAETSDGWRFTYRLRARDGADVEFTEHIGLPTGTSTAAEARLARLLFLVAGLSYYKAAAPPRVELRGGWSDVETTFLSTVLEHGLGEFAYVNDLVEALHPQVHADQVVPHGDAVLVGADADHALTPVGGGKDSCVTLDAARRRGVRQTLFSVNHHEAITAVAAAAGLPLVEARRSLSPAIHDLNARGALNGHVPVTAVNSLIALMAACRIGAGMVLMSNERSASEENVTWQGHAINHQWSKGVDFEALLQQVLAATVGDLQYFSVLRDYSEYRIAQRFAELAEFHAHFVSCGRAFVTDESRRQRWCGQCPKCRFVALILAPFLGPDRLWQIFGQVLFRGDPDPFLLLAGIGGHKPLECVGEVAETRLAIDRAAHSPQWADDSFLQGLRAAIPDEAMPSAEQVRAILSPGPVSLAPEGFRRVLEDR